MGIRKGGKSPRRKVTKLKGLADYKKIGWKIKRSKKAATRRKGSWTAAKKGKDGVVRTVCASCTRSLMNHMMAKEPC